MEKCIRNRTIFTTINSLYKNGSSFEKFQAVWCNSKIIFQMVVLKVHSAFRDSVHTVDFLLVETTMSWMHNYYRVQCLFIQSYHLFSHVAKRQRAQFNFNFNEIASFSSLVSVNINNWSSEFALTSNGKLDLLQSNTYFEAQSTMFTVLQ